MTIVVFVQNKNSLGARQTGYSPQQPKQEDFIVEKSELMRYVPGPESRLLESLSP